MPVLHVSPKGKRGGRYACVGCWKTFSTSSSKRSAFRAGTSASLTTGKPSARPRSTTAEGRRNSGSRGADELRGQGPQGGPRVQRCRVRAERTSWPRADLAAVYASDDRPRRQGTGKLSRSAKQFVSDCAEKGSISPERFGCCHGQTRGMIASFISRAFGRVSLRGVARVRHAAFTAATGSKQYAAGHST